MIVARPQEDAEAWLTGKRPVQDKQLTVAGFDAAETRNGESCNVVVDAADKQSLDIQLSPSGNEITNDQSCEKAKQGAELVMQTLLQR
ncbi:DUF3558 family protein [Streptoalloteichus hindustanus]|uniref:DUF3558 domain-containing protein n=1 Tax=Streptoalloteichus hindustanus TaxID=2017 RepID=A0A1M5NRW0_STRHI|nr:DUF3558 family protein [Streptoalloteichus hindustanus]SHG91673.1 Protein of unknown function [Streptoalloteichus hindustanus]